MVLAALPWATDRPDVDALRPAWQRRGLCVEGHPGVSWFPEKGESTARAKAICQRCPVIGQCLDYALTVGPALQGVWANPFAGERIGMDRSLRRRKDSTAGG